MFFIPNSFTPNDDEKNQVFLPILTAGYKKGTYKLTIFNRWGELVYQTNNYNNQWAGTRNNEQLPDGVYFYSIKCSNSDEYTGEINLLRFKK